MELSYAFNWLTERYGAIQLLEFTEATELPQKFASAASTLDDKDFVGADFKVILPLGAQQVRGTNYYFLAEEQVMTYPSVRRLVTLAVNEFEGEFTLVKESIREVF